MILRFFFFGSLLSSFMMKPRHPVNLCHPLKLARSVMRALFCAALCFVETTRRGERARCTNMSSRLLHIR